MAQFMPVTQEKAEALRSRLEQTIFRTPEAFVAAYNSGLINKRFDDVVAIVAALTATFRDLREKNGSIYFVDMEEVYLEELKAALAHVTPLMTLRRSLRDLRAAGKLGDEDLIVFFGDDLGYAKRKSAEGEIERVSGKLFTKEQDIREIYENLSTERSQELEAEGSYRFRLRDLTEADLSFVTAMHALLPAAR